MKNCIYNTCVFLVSIFVLHACRQQDSTSPAGITTGQDAGLFDSLKAKAQVTTPDSAIAIYQNIIELSKTKQYNIELSNAYCEMAILYAAKKDDFEKGKKILDSAAVIAKDLPALQQHLLVKYGQLYARQDSSLYYFRQALVDSNALTAFDKFSVYKDLSLLFYLKKNNVLAQQYALKAISMITSAGTTFRSAKEKITVLNNLYLIELALKDTATAFHYLQQADMLQEDSLPVASNANVYQNLGKYYLQKNKPDSAALYFTRYLHIIERDYSTEFGFYPQLYFAEVALQEKKYERCKNYLQKAAAYMNPDSADDEIAQREYFETAYQLHKASHDDAALALMALEKHDVYNEILHSKEKDAQVLEYEKQLREATAEKTIAQKQAQLITVQQQRNKSVLLAIIGILSLLILSLMTYLRMRRSTKKLHEQLNELNSTTQYQIFALQEQTRLAVETEQKKLGMNLHDDLGASLAALRHQAAAVLLDEKEESKRILLQSITQRLTFIYDRVRTKSHYLFNNSDMHGQAVSFANAVHNIVDNALPAALYETTISIDEQSLDNVPINTSIQMLQIINESISNILKHSRAKKIDILLYEENNTVLLSVIDNGKGFTAAKNDGLGLRSIRHRVSELKGTFTILTAPGKGTELKVNFPVDPYWQNGSGA